MKVCIIGAGPSGLVAAKTLLHNAAPGGARNLAITVYDAKSRIGGLWPQDRHDSAGLVHPLMVLNQSRHTVQFSDLAWESDVPDFPRAWLVGQYLKRYWERYLQPHRAQRAEEGEAGVSIRLGYRVESATPKHDGSWDVTVSTPDGRRESSVFSHLIVASGYFALPWLPTCAPPVTTISTPSENDSRQTQVPVIHSSAYRDLVGLLGRRRGGGKILVVGGQMSGVEIAATIATDVSTAASSPVASPIEDPDKYTVHHLIQKPAWIFPLFTPVNPENAAPSFLPVDVTSYNLSKRPKPLVNLQGHITEEAARQAHTNLGRSLGLRFSPSTKAAAILENDRHQPPNVAMSQHYVELVQSGLIGVSRGYFANLGGNVATVSTTNPGGSSSPGPDILGVSSSESIEDIAAVVFATGFDASPAVDFFPKDVRDKLQHDPAERDLALALGFHGTYSPALPTLGFVGFYRSPYWGVMEMQARFLTKLWTPGVQSNDAAAFQAKLSEDTSINRTLQLRGDPRRSQFPMGDYAFLMQEFSDALGLQISPSPIVSMTLERGRSDIPVMDILTPSRFLSTYASPEAQTENNKSLEQVRSVVIGGLIGTRYLASAVFRGLLGRWRLERELKSTLPSHPSGRFSGTAEFVLRGGTTDGLTEAETQGSGIAEEYWYTEEGDFVTDSGMRFTARRQYVWRYNEQQDQISVWFVKPEDPKCVDYLFHEVRFKTPTQESESEASPATSSFGLGAGAKVWHAESGHLCIDDFYDVAYDFEFAAVALKQWTVGYRVNGPKKDYRIHGVYTRPEGW